MSASQFSDADACVVRSGLPLNLAEERNIHRQLADDLENGEGKDEPQLLVPLDLHNTAVFDDENVCRGHHAVQIRLDSPQECEEGEHGDSHCGIGEVEGDANQMESFLEDAGGEAFGDHQCAHENEGSAESEYHDLLDQQRNDTGIYDRQHIKAHETQADVVHKTLPSGERLIAHYFGTVCLAAGNENVLGQLGAGFHECLEVTLGPAYTLNPCGLHVYGLFIIELCAVIVRDLVTVCNCVSAERTVFGEGCVVPTVLDDFPSEEEAGTLDTGCQTEEGACAVLVTNGTQPVDTVGSGDPVIVEVFGVTVRGNDLFACIERIVHAGDKVFFKKVVCVEDEVAFVCVDAVIAADAFYQIFQCKALGAVLHIVTLVADSAHFAGNLCGAVVLVAVVGNNEDVYQFSGVILLTDTVDEVTDNLLLVAGSNQDGVFVVVFCGLELTGSEQAGDLVDRFVAHQVADEIGDAVDNVDQTFDDQGGADGNERAFEELFKAACQLSKVFVGLEEEIRDGADDCFEQFADKVHNSVSFQCRGDTTLHHLTLYTKKSRKSICKSADFGLIFVFLGVNSERGKRNHPWVVQKGADFHSAQQTLAVLVCFDCGRRPEIGRSDSDRRLQIIVLRTRLCRILKTIGTC